MTLLTAAFFALWNLSRVALNDGRRNAAFGACLQEMPRHDLMDHIMPAVAHRERELHLVPAELARIKCRLHRHHVIERCKTEPATGTQKDAEVLGVTVSRAEKPEEDLSFEKQPPVRFRIIAALKQVQDCGHARATIRLVLAR